MQSNKAREYPHSSSRCTRPAALALKTSQETASISWSSASIRWPVPELARRPFQTFGNLNQFPEAVWSLAAYISNRRGNARAHGGLEEQDMGPAGSIAVRALAAS